MNVDTVSGDNYFIKMAVREELQGADEGAGRGWEVESLFYTAKAYIS